jgi:hypothetical protein
MIPKQGSMLSDVPEKVLGDNRDKIKQLFEIEPEIANNDRLLMLCFWGEFDGLMDVLGDKYGDFGEWFLTRATNPESLRRPRQSMTEYGELPQASRVKKRRGELADVWRKYWGKYR